LWAGATDEPVGSTGPSCPVPPACDVQVNCAQRGQIVWGRVDLDTELPADHAVRAIAAVVDDPGLPRTAAPPKGRRGLSDKLDLRGRYAEVRAHGEIAGAPAIDPKILPGLWVYTTSGDRARPGGSDIDGVRGREHRSEGTRGSDLTPTPSIAPPPASAPSADPRRFCASRRAEGLVGSDLCVPCSAIGVAPLEPVRQIGRVGRIVG
jgi:hypothetical protein